jgi:hypothetical protein
MGPPTRIGARRIISASAAFSCLFRRRPYQRTLSTIRNRKRPATTPVQTEPQSTEEACHAVRPMPNPCPNAGNRLTEPCGVVHKCGRETPAGKPLSATSRHRPPDRVSSLVMKGSPVRVRASASEICRDFLLWDRALMKGSGVYQRSTLVKCSEKRNQLAGLFFITERERRPPKLSSPVTPSALHSGLTPSAVVKGSGE